MHVCCARAAIVPLLGVWLFATAAVAQEASFAGKTVTVAIGSGTGGSHDQYGRLVARHIGEYLPGQPTVVPKNFPGAGGMTLANLLWSQAPRDGSMFGIVGRTIYLEPLINGANAKGMFDAPRFSWIGSADSIIGVAIAWHTSPVKTYKDLLDHELIVGAAGAASGTTKEAYIMRNLLGFRFRVIMGYPSGGDVDLAMERGEIDGRANVAWPGLKSRGLKDVEEGRIRMLYQMGLTRHPELPDLPLVTDFARDERERKILELNFGINEVGYSFAAPPDVPAGPLGALRGAFRKALADPRFVAEAAKQKLDVNYIPPERLQAVFAAVYATAPEMVAEWLRVSQPAVADEAARAATVRAALAGVRGEGRAIAFDDAGVRREARIDDEDTAVTIGGVKAERSALAPGLVCAITYFGDKGTATKVACDAKEPR